MARIVQHGGKYYCPDCGKWKYQSEGSLLESYIYEAGDNVGTFIGKVWVCYECQVGSNDDVVVADTTEEGAFMPLEKVKPINVLLFLLGILVLVVFVVFVVTIIGGPM